MKAESITSIKTLFVNLVAICILTLVFVSISFAESDEGSEQANLFGDWLGFRQSLEDKGIAMDSVLTLDTIGNVSGGLERKAVFLGNYDLTASIDTEKAGLWADGTIFTYILANFGEAPSSIVGDTQASDNIEAPETIKLYEAWYEHSLFAGASTLRIGLYDYNSEFDALNFAGGLINSSFGISPDISQVGPSIFPTTSLAVRLKVLPAENYYMQGTVYDGIPGDPNNERGTRIRFDSGDGLFYGLELGREGGEGIDYWKAAAGFWYHTAEFEDFKGELQDNNCGMYYIGEKMLLAEEDGEQGLGAFIQTGFARAKRNQVQQYYGVGLSYTGVVPNRNKDVLSFGVANALNGSEFVDQDDSIKRAIELNYRLQATPYFALTPDVQYIINPGTTKGVDDALVLGLRTEIAM